MALNAVIEAIDAGHIASFRSENRLDPHECKQCRVLWPCAAISLARQAVRRLHGVKKAA